ncbi:MAG: FliO/MopB family protein [Syntrophobacteraceae bacterium]
MTSEMLFLRTFGALALVVGLFLAIAYALKRWGNLSRRPVSQTMEVVSRQSFGPRHHLIMVKVCGQRNVLVGISPQNMSLLYLGDPAAKDGNPSSDPGENP